MMNRYESKTPSNCVATSDTSSRTPDCYRIGPSKRTSAWCHGCSDGNPNGKRAACTRSWTLFILILASFERGTLLNYPADNDNAWPLREPLQPIPGSSSSTNPLARSTPLPVTNSSGNF